jgi:hypothetical protein
VLGQEGAFGTHLLEKDVVSPALTFGLGGILDAHALKGAGLGLGDCTVSSDATMPHLSE